MPSFLHLDEVRPRTRARLWVALVAVLFAVGCGPSRSPVKPASHVPPTFSPQFLADVDYSPGGHWYLLYLEGERASVLDGVDAIRAARDQITVTPDPPSMALVARGPAAELHLVRDGKIVKGFQAFRTGDVSLGTTAGEFLSLTSCPVTLRRRDEARYLQAARAGQIFIDDPPDLAYDDYFNVTLPAFALREGPENGARVTSIERTITTGLRTMFPADSFDVQITESTIFPVPYVDATGKTVATSGRADADADSWKIYTPNLQIRASDSGFYRRMLARRPDLDRLTRQPNVPTTLGATFENLAQRNPTARRPIQIADALSPTLHTAIDTLNPLSTDDTYFVKSPPCPFGS